MSQPLPAPAVPYQQRDLWLGFAAVIVGTLLWQGSLLFVSAVLVSGAVVHHVPATYAGFLRWLALGLFISGQVLNLVVLIRLIRRARPAVVHGTWAGIAVLALLLVLLVKFVLVLQDYAQAMRD